jgi:hypothetical protein
VQHFDLAIGGAQVLNRERHPEPPLTSWLMPR